MKLADVVAHSGLALYAEIALVLFAVAFLAILWRVLAPRHAREYEAARQLPLAPDDRFTDGDPR